MIVRLKAIGPLLPIPFVAVTWNVFTAAVVGVPPKTPDELNEDHTGSEDPLQAIGAVPFAVN